MMIIIFNGLFIFLWLVRYLHATRSKNPYIYFAPNDALILPEDYEPDIYQPTLTTEILPGKDFTDDTEVATVPSETKDENEIDYENRFVGKSSFGSFRHSPIKEKYKVLTEALTEAIDEYVSEQWPLVVPLEVTSSSTEHLTTLSVDYPFSSSIMKTWRSYFPTRQQKEYGRKIIYSPTRPPKINKFGETTRDTQHQQTYRVVYFLTKPTRINKVGKHDKIKYQDTTRVPYVLQYTDNGNTYYSDLQEFEKSTPKKNIPYKKPYSIQSSDYEILYYNTRIPYKNPSFAKMKEFRKPNSTKKTYHEKEPASELLLDLRKTHPTIKTSQTIKKSQMDELIKQNFSRKNNFREFGVRTKYFDSESAYPKETTKEIKYLRRTSPVESIHTRKSSAEVDGSKKLFFTRNENKNSGRERFDYQQTYLMENTSLDIPHSIAMDENSTIYFTTDENNELATEMSRYKVYPTKTTLFRAYTEHPYSKEIDKFRRIFFTRNENKESVSKFFDYKRLYATENTTYEKPHSYENSSVWIHPYRRIFFTKSVNKGPATELSSYVESFSTENIIFRTSNEKPYSKEIDEFRRQFFPRNENKGSVFELFDYERTNPTENTTYEKSHSLKMDPFRRIFFTKSVNRGPATELSSYVKKISTEKVTFRKSHEKTSKDKNNELATEMSHYKTYPTKTTLFRAYTEHPYSKEIDEFRRQFFTRNGNKESVTKLVDYERTYPTENTTYENPYSFKMDPYRRIFFTKSVNRGPATELSSYVKKFSTEKVTFRKSHEKPLKDKNNELGIEMSHYKTYPTKTTLFRAYTEHPYSKEIDEFRRQFFTKNGNEESMSKFFDYERTYPTENTTYEDPYSFKMDPYRRIFFTKSFNKGPTTELSSYVESFSTANIIFRTSNEKPYSKEIDEFRRHFFTRNENEESETKLFDYERTYPTENTTNEDPHFFKMDPYRRSFLTKNVNKDPATEISNIEGSLPTKRMPFITSNKKPYSKGRDDFQKLYFIKEAIPKIVTENTSYEKPSSLPTYLPRLYFTKTKTKEHVSTASFFVNNYEGTYPTKTVSFSKEIDDFRKLFFGKYFNTDPWNKKYDYGQTYPTPNKKPYSISFFTEKTNKEFVTEMPRYEGTSLKKNKPFRTYATKSTFHRKRYSLEAKDFRKLKESASENEHYTKHNSFDMDEFRKLMELYTVIPYKKRKNAVRKGYPVKTDNKQNFVPKQRFKLKKKSKYNDVCYQCGINGHGVKDVSTSECYKAFDDPSTGRYLIKKYRMHCQGETYIGGCSKRFLDISDTFNERACRHIPPLLGHSYASERFARLELVLQSMKNGCTASPAASLVPFNRAISLFTRFHVCVCNTRLCNNSSMKSETPSILCSLFFVHIYISNKYLFT
ncbi:hypothetical protein PYW08_000612 [Mythimna loreyi]|uniref:Uncharacterized protein n=1 Tax=Mythimna loreyi TaxID=667449 RepID=A0ACC2RCX2_9NEOP|nr:hypothetical protein PYW08_000612 [Mythimna loreyi]